MQPRPVASGRPRLLTLPASAARLWWVALAVALAAVLFAANPLHTEAVTWVSGFPEVSFTFFYLLSLYFYMNAVQKGLVYAYSLSAAFFFISLLCKETALTLPLIIMCYEHIYLKSKAKPAEYLKRYAPFLLATAVYLARLLKPLGVKVSRIAMGIPVGSDLEFADEVTIWKALEGRREL